MPAPRKNYQRRAPAQVSQAALRKALASLKPAAPRRRAYAPRKQSGMLASAGKQLGAMGDNLLGRWLGSGDYTVKQNTIIKPASVPVMHSDDNSVRIRHKEYIQDVVATSDFSNQSFPINPGLANVFPYLSGIAQNFEMYRVHGMVWTFKSTSADALNSTNTALGSIFMATDYNSLDSAFTTKQGMLATTFSNSGKPACDILHPIECAKDASGVLQRYIRTGAITNSQALLNFDWGNFQLASQGQQATSTVGELWCSYDIELFNPQLVVPRGLTAKSAKYLLNTVTNAAPLGSGVATQAFDNLGVNGISFTSAGVITLPVGMFGKYRLDYNVLGNATASLGVTVSTTTNVTALSLLQNSASSQIANQATTCITYLHVLMFEVTDPTLGGVITLSSATLPANASAGDLLIQQINGNITV